MEGDAVEKIAGLIRGVQEGLTRDLAYCRHGIDDIRRAMRRDVEVRKTTFIDRVQREGCRKQLRRAVDLLREHRTMTHGVAAMKSWRADEDGYSGYEAIRDSLVRHRKEVMRLIGREI